MNCFTGLNIFHFLIQIYSNNKYANKKLIHSSYIGGGGSGTRLWPLSRDYFPKQFLKLMSGNSLLQDTLIRLDGLDIIFPIVICNENHRFIVVE